MSIFTSFLLSFQYHQGKYIFLISLSSDKMYAEHDQSLCSVWMLDTFLECMYENVGAIFIGKKWLKWDILILSQYIKINKFYM